MYCLLRLCFQMCHRLIAKINLKYVCACGILIAILDYSGAFTHMFERTYDESFSYPYNGDVHEFVSALRHNEVPRVPPINEYNYSFIYINDQKCVEPGYDHIHTVYLIKSAAAHFDRRLAIRNSWGFEKRFFDVPSRTVFLLGIPGTDEEVQAKIKLEAAKYKDILQANFIDTYYNNTLKAMTGFRWAVKYCPNSKFYMFVDDDIYVSVKNVLRFIRNPANYPDYLREPKKIEAHKREVKQSDFLESTVTDVTANKLFKYSLKNGTGVEPNASSATEPSKLALDRDKRQIFDFELPSDVRLFAGFVFVSSPHRHKTSKWYVSLEEYPYNLWPPYVTAGAYILSREALLDMYYTSFYTKYFKFDDIFLGLVAKKAEIEPFHCEEFHFYKKDYTKYNYKYVISSHGYGDPKELLQVWNEQKALGNA